MLLWSFLIFLREEVSVPEASERFGLPGRLRLGVGTRDGGLGCLEARPDGVLVPCEEAPDRGLDFLADTLRAFSTSDNGASFNPMAFSLAISASRAASASVSSDDDYMTC